MLLGSLEHVKKWPFSFGMPFLELITFTLTRKQSRLPSEEDLLRLFL